MVELAVVGLVARHDRDRQDVTDGFFGQAVADLQAEGADVTTLDHLACLVALGFVVGNRFSAPGDSERGDQDQR